MSFAHVDRNIGSRVAQLFGPGITLEHANKIAARARVLADARAKRSSVSNRVEVTQGRLPQDHQVWLSVTGRNGAEVASALEWGYKLHGDQKRQIDGKHIMRDAAFGGGK